MKKYSFLAVLFAVLSVFMAVLQSCQGTEGTDRESLTLSADRTTVETGSSVVFSVIYAGVQDVTSSSRIKCEQTGQYLQGNTYITSQEGEWSFVAEYDGDCSDPVAVSVIKMVESRFKKHVCVMEFTGQWCAQCPEGATTINYYATQSYPGLISVLAFHNANGGSEDIFEIPQEAVLYNMFNPGGYPGYVIDMRESGTVNGGSFSQDLKKAFATRTNCGVAVACSVDGTSAKVTARLFPELSSEYRVAVYVVEDKIVAKQNVSGTYREDYTHRHVVRQMLSADVRGDALGTVTAGEELTVEYPFSINQSWNIDNLSVCVLAIGEDGYVSNCADCKAAGGNTDYDEL